MKTCKKCETVGTIILRKIDFYCNACFENNVRHKFRASIGKNKILSANENVLICLSGGPGSIVLLNLIHNGISLDVHKKLRISPFFLHLTGLGITEENTNLSKHLIQQCKLYGFNIHIVHISDFMLSHSNLTEENSLPSVNNEIVEKFSDMLKHIPPTTKTDYITKVKRNLFVRYAKKLNCKFIFTAETTTTLAINLLSNIAIGRGPQIQHDIGFSDHRDDEIKILKPMREITKEELDYYMKIKNIKAEDIHDVEANSLQSIINSFVTDLQENYQATISTVCKTADKIGTQKSDGQNGTCVMCKSDIGRATGKLTALEATNYSRMVSLTQPEDTEVINFNNSDILDNSLFPSIHKSLCYGCSRNYSEMKNSKLPEHVQECL